MAPVFAHGRLRLYLLKLLDEAPRHGYEVIRLLEERFQGLYAPSAGTVYPRLAKLEAEGLVSHATEGGRKVYSLTDAGRAELAGRDAELADLELEIRESVAELAAEIQADVRGAAGDLRREMRAAATAARQRPGGDGDSDPAGTEAWRTAKEEMRRVKQEWKEQARRAKDESRRAREEAQRARHQAREAQEEVQRLARRVQEQVQDHFVRGDWPAGLRELAKELGDFSFTRTSPPAPEGTPAHDPASAPAPREPSWAHEVSGDLTGDPARDLDRLLDRFRDDIRDTARDHGVTADQFKEARRHLSTAAAHIGALLRAPRA
ncbi:helix-turn-helix transcriptional regulator [Streptomyces griseoviridis]|uniref:PadR family transcriptional regulator n=1 Tax=Streptomyces griseoviridis TaxID=45398 RepID=A0A918GBA3_STRGD|nr:PadR family transcriptional regulator [Streptomyces niveoruber]GGS27225.1 PadR family transcriptional regulator [Streptomyces niveoruber]